MPKAMIIKVKLTATFFPSEMDGRAKALLQQISEKAAIEPKINQADAPE